MEFIECTLLNSSSPYYVTRDGRVFNSKYEEVKGGESTKTSERRLWFKPTNSEPYKRKTISFPSLIYTTITGKKFNCKKKYIGFKDTSRIDKYAFDNLIIKNYKDLAIKNQKKRVAIGYKSLKEWHKNNKETHRKSTIKGLKKKSAALTTDKY